MENYVGKILGTVTPEELKEAKETMIERDAIQNALRDLFKKATDMEVRIEQDRIEWWARIRQKYDLPKEKDLRKDEIFGKKKVLSVSLETGELYIGLETK